MLPYAVMRPLTAILSVFVLVFLLIVPVAVSAAGLVPCSGSECQACHVTQLINNVVAWLFVVLSIVAAIMIAVAGIKMVVGGSNSGTLEEAKSTFTNIIIGFIILMGGWILIDTLMKALLGEGSQAYGMWNQIQCIDQPGVYNAPAGSGMASGTSSPYYNRGGGRGTGAQCGAGNTACSVDALTAAGFSQQQANVMSCIAMTESSGNPNARSNQSSACGTFQVIRGTWESVPRSAGCHDFSQCTNAACNSEVARSLVSRRGFGPWTCQGCNSRAQDCINRYGGT